MFPKTRIFLVCYRALIVIVIGVIIPIIIVIVGYRKQTLTLYDATAQFIKSKKLEPYEF